MRALYVTADLLFSSRVTQAARGVGLELQVLPSTEAALAEISEGETCMVLLDLGRASGSLQQFLQDLRAQSASTTVVAYGPHVDDEALGNAQSAGCDLVLSKGQFDRQLKQLLTHFVQQH